MQDNGNQPSSNQKNLEKSKETQNQSKTRKPDHQKSFLQPYIDYNLSEIKDTRAGYLTQDVDELPDKVKKLQNEATSQENLILHDRPVSLVYSENPTCFECKSLSIDNRLFSIFKIRVCRECKSKYPEKYSLLTKTECKEDYLLTEPELRDVEILPHMLRPNPHKTTFSNMMLYVRFQVEEYAFKKWGGEKGLDDEYERRLNIKKRSQEDKLKESLVKLRKKTITSEWANRRLEKFQTSTKPIHEHVFSENQDDGGQEVQIKTCTICGLQVEELKF